MTADFLFMQFFLQLSRIQVNLTFPHLGDGEGRLNYAGTGGYYRPYGKENWLPNSVFVEFAEGRNQYMQPDRSVQLSYRYLDQIYNIKRDSDEGLELEVLLYNYNGESWIGNIIQDWWSNQPNAYLDTRFGDKPIYSEADELAFCVGVANAHPYIRDYRYWWGITGDVGVNSTSSHYGKYKISGSRMYYKPTGGFTSGTPSTWNMFPEEHEGYQKLKDFHTDYQKAPVNFTWWNNR